MQKKITIKDYFGLLVNSFLGIGILSLASDLAKVSEQSAWISAILSGIPSLLIILIVYFLYKQTERKDFASLLECLYGKTLSKILFCFFFIHSLIQNTVLLYKFTLVIKMSFARYMPVCIIAIIISALSILICSKDINIIGRLSTFVLFFVIPILLVPCILMYKGDVKNVLPVVSSYKKIFSSLPKSILAYTGAESTFFIMYLLDEDKHLLKSSMYGIGTIILLYAISVFSIIYYLGYELTGKLTFPVIFCFEVIRLPLFSDFKELFMLTWSFTILATSAFQNYQMSYVVKSLYKKISNKILFIILLPLITASALLAIFYQTYRVKYIIPLSTITNIILYIIVLISFIICIFKFGIRRGDKNNKFVSKKSL
ncbi:GerAB/ArcD/ProY family transporter [Hathewaya histolytica]